MTKTTHYFSLIIWYIFACILRHEVLCSQGLLATVLKTLVKINCIRYYMIFSVVSLTYEGVHSSICLGDSFEVTCISTTSVICWGLTFPNVSLMCDTECFNPITSMSNVICNFSLTLLSRNPYTSTATLASINSDDDGAVLTCKSTFAMLPEPDELASITLMIQGTSHNKMFFKY